MTEVERELIAEVRENTGEGFIVCRKALWICSFDVEKATEYVREGRYFDSYI